MTECIDDFAFFALEPVSCTMKTKNSVLLLQNLLVPRRIKASLTDQTSTPSIFPDDPATRMTPGHDHKRLTCV